MTTPIHGALPPPKQIRFVNNQGQPPSKRRRINAASPLFCEKPDCSTCKKNGHVCLGYSDLPERRRDDRRSDGLVMVKTETADTPSPSNGHVNDYQHERLDDPDAARDHRRWAHRTGPPPPPAGFVDDAFSRSDSRTSTGVAQGRQPGSGSWDHQPSNSASPRDGRQADAPQNHASHSDDRRANNRSPLHLERHRVPYFRYFGPTAIVPGFKQMVVQVYRDNRRMSRGGSFSAATPGSPLGHGLSQVHGPYQGPWSNNLEDLPVYDVNSSAPVHPLIISLVETFFLHLGCNYHFLRKDRFLRLLKEKRVEPILVDAVCALAARFSTHPVFTNAHGGKMKRSEYGHVFAQRAKAATVDTFPCPSVAAVQACLLMAYEGFGADQDSALWMYLGIAIRMAVDLGLQKMEGVKYQGERDPWYTRYWSRRSDESDKHSEDQTLSKEEQKEVEQERIDTFWAVFVLDRVISSGTGRPVTFRDDDFELSLPPHTFDPVTERPDPFPPFIEIIHLYGRASDVLNNIRNANDLTEEKMNKLKIMERDLTAIYQKQHPGLHFNAANFKEYVKTNQGTTFILLHFWFHALVIILHQPTLLTPFHNLSPTQLLANSSEYPNSRELSMSSAKTIADILAFAELIDPKSLIGNPFTSQPIYIAACAFLMESVANTSQPPSRAASPTPELKGENFKSPAAKSTSGHDSRRVKHSILASAANENYQRCYQSLQQLEQYWGGVGYILTALDQKSKGIWDCETFTDEEYKAMMRALRGPLARLGQNPASPKLMACSLTGTTNSPNTNLTVLFSKSAPPGGSAPPAPPVTQPTPPPPPAPTSAPTPPGNMIYDPIRQSLPETPAPAYPAPFPQPNVSAVRYQPHPSKARSVSQSPVVGKSILKYESPSPAETRHTSPPDAKSHMYGAGTRSSHAPLHVSSYSHPYDAMGQESSPSTATPTDTGMGHQQHSIHDHPHGQDHDNGIGQSHHDTDYDADFSQSGLASGSYSYTYTGALTPINDMITFNSQEVNFGMLGLDNEMMPPWLETLPVDVLGGLMEGGITGVAQHMG
ncbi:hypothetical protein VTJ49DRAFT_4829 [Mycothermus thermophilus]|uniref:Xylanolytic transcriptional activator regulatory domain-containing protein n=1 Tax=Humicola insolens TaxID=85995 RepID=A0ABR3V4Y7_HUMIN